MKTSLFFAFVCLSLPLSSHAEPRGMSFFRNFFKEEEKPIEYKTTNRFLLTVRCNEEVLSEDNECLTTQGREFSVRVISDSAFTFSDSSKLVDLGPVCLMEATLWRKKVFSSSIHPEKKRETSCEEKVSSDKMWEKSFSIPLEVRSRFCADFSNDGVARMLEPLYMNKAEMLDNAMVCKVVKVDPILPSL